MDVNGLGLLSIVFCLVAVALTAMGAGGAFPLLLLAAVTLGMGVSMEVRKRRAMHH